MINTLTLTGAGSADFFDVDGCAVVVNRSTGEAWAWTGGFWSSYLGLVYKNYADEPALEYDEFIRRYPKVALMPPRV